MTRAVTYNPGCVTEVFDIPLQPEVSPGHWKIEGHFQIQGGGQFSATSNEFEVVP